jgi:hypothetical protein
MNLFRSGCSVFGGVSVRTRFFVFAAANVGVDPGVGALEKGNDSHWWWLLGELVCGEIAGRRRPPPIESADSLGGADGAADFSDGVLGVGAVTETCTVARGAFTSASADMAAGKLGRQFPNIALEACGQMDDI